MSVLPRTVRGRRTGRVLALLLLATVGVADGLAQVPALDRLGATDQFIREHWTVEDGLPVNSVNDLLQSGRGYLWLATFDGLVRFDGVRFRVYQSGDHAGLPSSRITTLHEGQAGAIWLITQQHHLVRYRDGTFTHVDSLRGRGNLEVFTVRTDSTGTPWFGTSRGLARVDGGRVELARPRPDTADVLSIDLGNDGVVWLGTRNRGLLRVAPDGRVAHSGGQREVRVLHRDSQGRLWAGTPTGAYRVRPDGSFVPVQNDGTAWGASVLEIQSTEDGTLWFGAASGTYRERNGEIRRFAPETAAEASTFSEPVRTVDTTGHTWIRTARRLHREGRVVLATPNRVTCVLHDRERNTWVGTAANGLYRLRPASFHVIGEPEGLPSGNIYPVLQARSWAVWLGTLGGGVVRIAGDEATRYPRREDVPPEPDNVWALHQDRDGTLWVGGVGMCRMEADRCYRTRLPSALQSRVVRAIYEDTAGRLWAGTQDGLFRRRAGCSEDSCWTRFTTADGLPHNRVRVIHERPSGPLWMGTNGGGLARFREGSFSSLTAADGLSSNLIRSIYEDPRGVLWVGTEDAGLNRIDPRGSTAVDSMPITTYRETDGLFDRVVHQILPDSSGRLWMSTNRGLFWVRREQLEAFHRGEIDRIQSTSYTERDGLRTREANGGVQPAGMRDRQGRLWFPTQEGVVIVDPSDIRQNPVPPPVVVERITADSVRFDPPRQPSERLVLAPDQRDFTVKYTALSYVDPSKVRFRYRLEGFDEQWVEAGTRRQAFYTNVPSGTYTFRVRARNDDGVWNEEGTAVTVTVEPFLYETWGFYGACVLLLLALGTGAVRWRTRRLQQRQRHLEQQVADRTEEVRAKNEQLAEQAERLQELDAAKSRFFANISHEFRTPLTLLLGPLDDALETDGSLSEEQLRRMHRNAERLQHLINQLLDLSALDAGGLTIEPAEHDLVPFVRQTARAFLPLAERKDLELVVEPEPETLPWPVDRDKLEKVLANLFSNAINFTPSGGTVHVRLTTRSTDGAAPEAVLMVRDTGPGIPADEQDRLFDRFHQVDASSTRDQEGSGIGLALARELVELHGGTIEVESAEGEGATFFVHLPASPPVAQPRPDAEEGKPADSTETPTDPPAGVEPSEVPLPLSIASEGTQDEEHPPSDARRDRPVVLVVDDHADVRQYVRSVLEDRFEVQTAADGAEGLSKARDLLPDCVVADVMMPELDGFAMGRALQDDPLTEGIPLLFLTARATEADEVEGLSLGADAYLTKPFSAEVLRARVRGLIEKRHRLRERLRGDGGVPDAPPSTEASPFVEEVRAAIQDRLADPEFGVSELADALALSRSQLYRRLQAELDCSPSELIQQERLRQAHALLRQREGTVTEIGYAVGFNSLSHFCQVFRERYDTSPSDVLPDTPA